MPPEPDPAPTYSALPTPVAAPAATTAAAVPPPPAPAPHLDPVVWTAVVLVAVLLPAALAAVAHSFPVIRSRS
ncbi:MULTISPECIES: hypothetical protein [Kitasatospora]|uniref:SpdD protein n=1 Tax=Kitasatospora cystarginea TaxID=58350 RepID=A0ABN3DF44_9ACTN